MKAADKELRRKAAEKRNAPIHLLIIINNMVTQIIYGLEGGKLVEGVQVPALDLPQGQKTWCLKQCAKIIRWTAANLQRYGFKFGVNMPSGLWHTGLRKVLLVGRAISHYAPQAQYQDQCIIQLIVAETAWHNICFDQADKSREAKWLSQTIATLTDKFTDGEDFVATAATDVYLHLPDMLDGTATVDSVSFSTARRAA